MKAESPTMSTSDRTTDADERFEEPQTASVDIGERLRRAREAKELSIEAVASELRLTTTVIRQIEAGKWDGLGVPVYARGYLRGFAQLVDSDVSDAEAVFEKREPVLPLTDLPRAPRPSKLPSLVSYAVATALVAIPVVVGIVMLLNYDFGNGTTESAPVRAVGASMTPRNGGEQVATTPAAEKLIELPVVSSGFEAGKSATESEGPADAVVDDAADSEAAETTETQGRATSSGQQRSLSLKLREDAWIDIRSDSGERIEYGLKPAGSQIEVVLDGGITARLGNADAIDASLDGQRLDVMQYARQEVAVLQMGSDGGISRAD